MSSQEFRGTLNPVRHGFDVVFGVPIVPIVGPKQRPDAVAVMLREPAATEESAFHSSAACRIVHASKVMPPEIRSFGS